MVCFETLDSSNRHFPSETKNCQEVVTLGEISDFPITEVAVAASVSTLITVLLACLLCCFCFKKQNKIEKPLKDENGNVTTSDEKPAKMDPNLDTIERPGSPNNRSISNSMATTFEPELQSIMTEKETEEMVTRDSKFRERYTTQIPKGSQNNTEMHAETKTRFWKSCLSSKQEDKQTPKVPIEEVSPKKSKKFEETQEYLRRPNALYQPWHNTGPPEHYHTLPNPHHFHHVHHVPHHTHTYDHYGPGSYHTIAHYQLYKRPAPVHHICSAGPPPPPAPPPVPPNHPSGIVMDFHRATQVHDYAAQTLGRRKEVKKESEMVAAGTAIRPVKLKKLIKSKMLMHQGAHQHPHHPHIHHMHEDHMKMYTWSPYSSHMLYNEPIAGKSLDELRF